jgi:hypothetical protein
MAHSTLVKILNARDEFLIKLACLFLTQSLVLDDIVEKLSTSRKLHDHEQVFFGFDNL